jgi:AcrR family transcriptional regulator
VTPRSPGRNGHRATTAPGPNGTSSQPKARRTAEEVDRLLVDAARTAFTERGYSGTSTRDICDAAGVSEALLFRHFGTKADLFDAAVLEPFHMFVGRFITEWESQPIGNHSAEELCRGFLAGLYGLLKEHRELAMTLLGAMAFESRELGHTLETAPSFAMLLRRLERVAGEEAAAQGFDFNVPVAVRAVSAMTLCMALLDPWLFPDDEPRPSDQEIVIEMTQLMMHGLSRREGVKSR